MNRTKSERIIVSFTSHPKRIDSVKQVLDSLYAQTLQADEIILWLAEEEFPNKEADLPKVLQEDLSLNRFTLRWCDNLGSHKKYFYAMQEYPEDIIVTVDDDLYYHPDSLEKLMRAHERYPNAVAALTTYLVRLDENLYPLPIRQWYFDFRQFSEPSMFLMAGSGGGTLFPPHSIDRRIFDKQLIYDTCSGHGRIFADDLLLKAGEMLQNIPVLSVMGEPYYRLPDTQETALSQLVPGEEHNNRALKRIENHFRDAFDENDYSRLKEEATAFKQSEQYYASVKKHWLERPSRDLQRQLGYLTLTGTPNTPNDADRKKIEQAVQLAETVFCAYPAHKSDDDTLKAIHAFRQQILDIPGIHTLKKTSISIRGLIEYGKFLGINTIIALDEIPVYTGRLHSWSEFIDENPQSEHEYLKGYGISIAYILFAYAWHRLTLIRSVSMYKRRMNKDVLPSPVGLIHNQMNKLSAGKKIVVINGILAGSVAALQKGVSKLVKSL